MKSEKKIVTGKKVKAGKNSAKQHPGDKSPSKTLKTTVKEDSDFHHEHPFKEN